MHPFFHDKWRCLSKKNKKCATFVKDKITKRAALRQCQRPSQPQKAPWQRLGAQTLKTKVWSPLTKAAKMKQICHQTRFIIFQIVFNRWTGFANNNLKLVHVKLRNLILAKMIFLLNSRTRIQQTKATCRMYSQILTSIISLPNVPPVHRTWWNQMWH